MEQIELETPTSLFSLSIDSNSKSHLSEAAKWAKFLSIVGMVMLALMIVFAIVGITMLNKFSGAFDTSNGSNVAGYGSAVFAIYFVVIGVIWFFPLLFTYRFANKMKVALAGNDQQALNTSFQNLKICYRYVGILTIVLLAIYALVIVFALIGAAALG